MKWFGALNQNEDLPIITGRFITPTLCSGFSASGPGYINVEVRVAELGWIFVGSLLLLESLAAVSPDSNLFEFDVQGGHFNSFVDALLPFKSDGGVKNFLCLFLVGDDLLDLLKKNIIVVVNQISLFALVIIENAAADVETVQHFVVMVKDLFKWESSGVVNAEDATNRADNNLIDFVLAEKSFAMFNDETD